MNIHLQSILGDHQGARVLNHTDICTTMYNHTYVNVHIY